MGNLVLYLPPGRFLIRVVFRCGPGRLASAIGILEPTYPDGSHGNCEVVACVAGHIFAVQTHSNLAYETILSYRAHSTYTLQIKRMEPAPLSLSEGYGISTWCRN